MFRKDELKRQMKALGVPSDRPVVVHTSLRAVGETEGRGDGFLDALREYVTADGGLLCVPTHTWHHCGNYSVPTLDVASDDVCVGTLPKLAVRSPLGHRSLHPTHSVAVFGDPDAAEELISHDKSVETSSDPRGVMGELVRRGGFVLLIGVGQNRNTFLHTAEEMLGIPNRLTNEPRPTSVRLADGRVIPHPLRLIHADGIRDVSANYPKLEPAFRAHGAIRYGKIGDADTQLCDAQKLLGVMHLIRDRAAGKELLSDDAPLDPMLYL